jgi:hypothetical protein
MKQLSTGVIVTRTKKNKVEVIKAYTPSEWEYHQLDWWNKAKQTINRFIG